MACPRAVGLRVVDGREVLYGKGIVGKLGDADVVEAAPNDVLLVELLDITRVDAVLDTYLGTAEELSPVGELSG